jgi:cGMP-dependent protein kinase
VSCTQQGQEVRKLVKGDFFGEQTLLYNCPRTATVIADGDVKCLSISRDQLTDALGSNLEKVIYRNSIRMAFEQSKVFKVLEKEQIDQLIDLMNVRSYEAGEEVIPVGTLINEAVWVVVKGKLVKGD